jgi:hypothetical protein
MNDRAPPRYPLKVHLRADFDPGRFGDPDAAAQELIEDLH